MDPHKLSQPLQKRMKKREPKTDSNRKEKKVVEDHYDDIGGDLSGLGADVKIYILDVCAEPISYAEHDDEMFICNLIYWFPRG